MNATIGIFDSHSKALEAVNYLIKDGYSKNQISLLSQAAVKKGHMHVRSFEKLDEVEISIGVIAGPILGLLTGLGIFVIPGLGFIFGAGAVVGILAGFDFGLIGGSLAVMLTRIGVSIEGYAEVYAKHLNEGKFLLIIHGTDEEANKAKDIIHAHNQHLGVMIH
jgi:uncharacterized membrane protein